MDQEDEIEQNLSNEQINAAVNVIKCHLRTGYMSGLKTISKRTIYRFFRDSGDFTIEILLISLADRLSARGVKVNRSVINKHKAIIEMLFNEYFKVKVEKPPVKLINGYDIIKKFKLQPSKLIGTLLEKVNSAQAEGKVNSKLEALEFIAKYLKTHKH